MDILHISECTMPKLLTSNDVGWLVDSGSPKIRLLHHNFTPKLSYAVF